MIAPSKINIYINILQNYSYFDKGEKSDRKRLHDFIKTRHLNYISNTVQQNKDQSVEIYHKFYSVCFYFKIET